VKHCSRTRESLLSFRSAWKKRYSGQCQPEPALSLSTTACQPPLGCQPVGRLTESPCDVRKNVSCAKRITVVTVATVAGSDASRFICGSTKGRLKDSSTRQDRRVLQEFESKFAGEIVEVRTRRFQLMLRGHSTESTSLTRGRSRSSADVPRSSVGARQIYVVRLCASQRARKRPPPSALRDDQVPDSTTFPPSTT
jgi:hypothetical protein